jgi:poly(A) polymerase
LSDLLSRAMRALGEAARDGYFVGGCVRDWLLERPLKDLDVAVPDHVEEIGRAAAHAVNGVFFWLREEMTVGRIVVRGDPQLQIDLVPLAGALEEDLRRRDFTVNAMAVAARDGLVPGATVIDPTGGRTDLASRRLRLAALDALERDPLRCLRAFRLRVLLGFTFSPGLETAIRIAGPALGRISGERIRDELFVLLERDQSAPVMADLLEYHLVAPWSSVLAASAARADDRALSHSPGEGEAAAFSPAGRRTAAISPLSGLDVLEKLDAWLAAPAPLAPEASDLESTLDRRVTPPRSRRALARLAALSIRAGSAAPAIARSLCLSAEETRILVRAVGGAGALEAALPSSGRDRLRFFQHWEPGAVEAALLALAAGVGGAEAGDREPGAGNTRVLSHLLVDLLERRLRPRPPLLRGEEIMAICRLSPGPDVGRCLQQVEELRAEGLLQTPEAAREWLEGRCGERERREES